MRRFSSWMLVILMVLFWIFRVIATLMTELKQDFLGITLISKEVEIVLLFVALACIVLVLKRKWLGAIIYLISYGLYFGADLFKNIGTIISSTELLPLATYINIFFSAFGLVLPVMVLIDLIADKDKSNNPKNKKTDWFYTNEQYDRKLDDRADKNNYRTL